MNEARLIGAFAFAGDFALVSSKRFEEVGSNGCVVELGGAGSEGVEVGFFGASIVHEDGIELFWNAGDSGDGVIEHFGHVASWEVAGEVALIGRVSFDGCAGALIGGAREDEAHELAQVEVSGGEVVCDGGEERFVGGGVGGAEIVDGVDDTDAEEVGPDAVGYGASEVGVTGRGEPVGEGFASVPRIVHRQRRSIEGRWGLGFTGSRLNEIAVGIDEKGSLTVSAASVSAPAFGSDACEQVCKGVILVVGPFLEWMVMALGAVDGESEKGLADVFSHRFGVLMDGVEVGGAVGEAVAFCGEHFADDLVPRGVAGDF